MAQLVKILPAMQENWIRPLGQEDSPGEGNGSPFQYSCLENSIDKVAWRATVHGGAELDTTDQLTLSLFEHSLALRFFGTGEKTDLFQSCGHCWVFHTC